MPTQPKAYNFRPTEGGGLFTNPSHEAVGAGNYTVKRNFRRVDNFEQISEGHDYFWINVTGDYANHPGIQPFPNLATAVTVESAAYASSAVTLTFPTNHFFQVGELIYVSGASEDGFNGQYAVTAVTHNTLTYTPPVTPPVGSASGILSARSIEPISLVCECRRPNGRVAFVCGTKTNLFRFYANDGDPYVETDYWEDGYTDDVLAGWEVIGRGYSVNGNRWQHENLNGFLILSNGVDLPLTYRVEDFEVTPIYELREAGVASLGSITTYAGMLIGGDVRQIKAERLEGIMTPDGITLSDGILLSQSATTVAADGAIFTSDDVGRFIEYADGDEAEITGFTSDTVVTVGTSYTKDAVGFKIRTKGSQAGSYFSLTDGGKTASMVGATTVVTISAAPSTAGVIGDTVRFANGFESVITAVNSTTEYVLTVADNPGVNFTSQAFWIVKANDNRVTVDVDLFTEEMVGRTILFSNGYSRTITGYVSATVAEVDSDYNIPEAYVSVENPRNYGRVDDADVDRIQWRLFTGEQEEPNRVAATIPCTTTAGSRSVILAYPVKSLDEGDEVIVTGAGLNGSNLLSTITTIAGGQFVTLSDPAELSVTTELQRSDTVGGTTGFFDLQDDGSGIVAVKPLQDALVIYKDTAIFIATYTGDAGNPLSIRRVLIPPNTGLYYRDTLITVEGNRHVYAGRRSFYQFDLTNQVPAVLGIAEGCRSVFFDGSDRSQSNQIFAADNAITKSTWFCFPTGDDKALIFDQLYGTPSTTETYYGAAGTVINPTSDAVAGTSDNLFVMAVGERLVIYGLALFDRAIWGGREYFWRRNQYPYAADRLNYDCILQSGLEAFGSVDTEKDLLDYVLLLASSSQDTAVDVELLSATNPTTSPDVADTLVIDQPEEYNQFRTLIRNNLLADKITVRANGEKLAISGRQYRVRGINSRGVLRAPGDF